MVFFRLPRVVWLTFVHYVEAFLLFVRCQNYEEVKKVLVFRRVRLERDWSGFNLGFNDTLVEVFPRRRANIRSPLSCVHFSLLAVDLVILCSDTNVLEIVMV